MKRNAAFFLRQRVFLFFAILWLFAVLGIARWIGAAFALGTAQRSIPNNAFTTRNLIAPNNLTATTSGRDVSLAWTAGANGNGYEVRGVNNGTNSNCTGAIFSTLATPPAMNYLDANHYLPQGTFFCYQVRTTYSTWSSQTSNPFTTTILGFVATSVQMINGGTAGQLDTGDQFIITFNQSVDTTTGPISNNTVCASDASGTIWLGSTTTGGSGNCQASETVTLGKISGGSFSAAARFAATYAWSNANKMLSITLGARTDGTSNPSIGAATWTFMPTTDTTKMKSATGAFHICDNNSGGGNCLPTTTGLP